MAAEEMARFEAGILRNLADCQEWADKKHMEEQQEQCRFGSGPDYILRFEARAREQRRWASLWTKATSAMQTDLAEIRRDEAAKEALLLGSWQRV